MISLETLALAKKYTDEHGGTQKEIGKVVTPTNEVLTLNMEANVRYIVNGAVSKITLNAPKSYNVYDEFYIMFTTSSNGCTVLAPSGWIYIDGSVETFEANSLYEFDAINGKIACIKEAVVN